MSPSRRQAPAAMEQAVSTDALREALELKIDELLDEFVAELDRKTFEDYAQKRNTYSSRIAALAAPASETTREYKHWPWCNGDRRIPAGEPGNSCCCFNDYAGRLAGAASETEKLPAKWRLESNKLAGTNMPRFLRQCADELEAALK